MIRVIVWGLLALIAGALAIGAFLALAPIARAHPPHAWVPIECCGENDCFPLDGVTVAPGGWRLPSGEIVPFDRTRLSRDPAGRFWRCYEDGAQRNRPRANCFFVPPGRS